MTSRTWAASSGEVQEGGRAQRFAVEQAGVPGRGRRAGAVVAVVVDGRPGGVGVLDEEAGGPARVGAHMGDVDPGGGDRGADPAARRIVAPEGDGQRLPLGLDGQGEPVRAVVDTAPAAGHHGPDRRAVVRSEAAEPRPERCGPTALQPGRAGRPGAVQQGRRLREQPGGRPVRGPYDGVLGEVQQGVRGPQEAEAGLGGRGVGGFDAVGGEARLAGEGEAFAADVVGPPVAGPGAGPGLAVVRGGAHGGDALLRSARVDERVARRHAVACHAVACRVLAPPRPFAAAVPQVGPTAAVREVMDTAVRMHRDMNFTMIRNWVGSSNREELYASCDEHGLLVWNDFPNAWAMDPPDHQAFLGLARDTVRRYRIHPSVVVWCGANEGSPPGPVDDGMRSAVRAEAPGILYRNNSAGGIVSGGGPYGWVEPERRSSPSAYGGGTFGFFHTGTGMPVVPTAGTMRRLVADEPEWPVGTAWYHHDWSTRGNQAPQNCRAAIEARLGPATGLDDFCRKAQFVDYENVRAMSHPAWYSTVWQTYDYGFDVNGACYGARKAAEPVHVQAGPVDGRVVAVNHTPRTIDGAVVVARWYDKTGRQVTPSGARPSTWRRPRPRRRSPPPRRTICRTSICCACASRTRGARCSRRTRTGGIAPPRP